MNESILNVKPSTRYCAFLDILGFKQALKKVLPPQSNDDVLTKLVSSLKFMADECIESAYSVDLPVLEESGGMSYIKELGDIKLTYISDCIIISAEHTRDGLKALCRKLTKIWLDLAWDGFFCRGAIAQGYLFHEKNIVFGSSYIEAYELEHVAQFPRVVFSKNIVDDYGGFPGKFPFVSPLCDSVDDFVHLKYFPFNFFPPYAFSWLNYLCRVRGHIVDNLAVNDVKIRDKYVFLAQEFNHTIDQYRLDIDKI